mmetsp:Transcript_10151/g.15268  ORF Transcript_10151/g.15268 Transcript_10151/m.15268 type:complete len:80 (+) Transcript_10151:293-532(+)
MTTFQDHFFSFSLPFSKPNQPMKRSSQVLKSIGFPLKTFIGGGLGNLGIAAKLFKQLCLVKTHRLKFDIFSVSYDMMQR